MADHSSKWSWRRSLYARSNKRREAAALAAQALQGKWGRKDLLRRQEMMWVAVIWTFVVVYFGYCELNSSHFIAGFIEASSDCRNGTCYYCYKVGCHVFFASQTSTTRSLMTRASVLAMVRLLDMCQKMHEPPCEVLHNQKVWPETDVARRVIKDGILFLSLYSPLRSILQPSCSRPSDAQSMLIGSRKCSKTRCVLLVPTGTSAHHLHTRIQLRHYSFCRTWKVIKLRTENWWGALTKFC